ADQQVGCAQTDRIERTANRDAQPLKTYPSEVLHGGQKSRLEDMERCAHAATPSGSGHGVIFRAPSAIRCDSSSYSDNETGAKLTVSPGARRGEEPVACSQSGTGDRPMTCQPQGVSIG